MNITVYCGSNPGKNPNFSLAATKLGTWIGLINKPTVFYNVDGYYESLKEQFDRMVQEEFLKLDVREMFLFSESLQEIDTFIREHS
ncbi:LOG family protein [Ruoffia sp. FAM 26255]|uniref:LOG family protein n=1 Tax=Ruoffia sp. FAM 26255 TaxID=3259519 RepID=UPI003888C1EC